MDTNELLVGLARAVVATKPAEEYCLRLLDQTWWTCLTKAEWASWAQAFGVVGTISTPFVYSFIKRVRAYRLLRAMQPYITNSLQTIKNSKRYLLENFDTPKGRLVRASQMLESIRHPYKEEIDAMSLIDPALGMRMLDLMRATELYPKLIENTLRDSNSLDVEIIWRLHADHIGAEMDGLISEWQMFIDYFPVKFKKNIKVEGADGA